MVRIKIYDLHPSTEKQLLNEITAGEMKIVEGGVSNSNGRQFSNRFGGNNPSTTSTTTEPETSQINSLEEVNLLLDNFRLELDKIFRRLV